MNNKSNEIILVQKVTRNQNGVDFTVIKNTLLFKKQKNVIKQHDLRVNASKVLFKNIFGYGYDFPIKDILEQKIIPSKIILETLNNDTILIFVYFNTCTNKINSVIDRLKNERCIGIDIGKKNTFAITNNISKKPILIKGTAMQKFYCEEPDIFKGYLKNSITFLQKYINENRIDTVYVGDMKKYEPYATIVDELLKLKNVKIVLVDEENTSKASFLDNDLSFGQNLGETKFSGKRINRSTYKTRNGIILSADINASYNILTKGNQLAFYNNPDIKIESVIIDISEIK